MWIMVLSISFLLLVRDSAHMYHASLRDNYQSVIFLLRFLSFIHLLQRLIYLVVVYIFKELFLFYEYAYLHTVCAPHVCSACRYKKILEILSARRPGSLL